MVGFLAPLTTLKMFLCFNECVFNTYLSGKYETHSALKKGSQLATKGFCLVT